MQVVRTELPPLKYLDGYIKLPSAKDAIFAELLPAVAVRRVGGNTTLYSVSYCRPKRKKAAKKAKEPDVSSPLIVTVYQSDMRAKTFRVLLKMKVDVRLTSDEHSYRYGVAVAVDEVAECVYAAYTRDEPPVGKRPPQGTRLLLRRVQLTLAAADARGVRRLQRPGGVVGARRSTSKIFEAKTYFSKNTGGNSAKVNANVLKTTRVVVQQLALDDGGLLLYFHWDPFPRDALWALAQLKLRENRSAMDVCILPHIDAGVCGNDRHKFAVGNQMGSPRECRDKTQLCSEPYWPVPTLFKLGAVADDACRNLFEAISPNSAVRVLAVGAKLSDGLWGPVGSFHRRLILSAAAFNVGTQMVAVRGLATSASQPQILSALVADYDFDVDYWTRVSPSFGRLVEPTLQQGVGSWLLVMVALQRLRQPLLTRLVILRVSLRSLLPPTTACANCHANLRKRNFVKKKVCKVCRIRGFVKYSWVFGCHYCSATCLRDAWPQHSRLHHTPPLRKWTDADWKQWRSDNSKP